MGMNTKAITNIQRQTGVLSDGHQEVVDQAVAATATIARWDDQMETVKGAGRSVGVSVYTHQVQCQLDRLQEQLMAQASRAIRVHNEIEQVKKNLRVI